MSEVCEVIVPSAVVTLVVRLERPEAFAATPVDASFTVFSRAVTSLEIEVIELP